MKTNLATLILFTEIRGDFMEMTTVQAFISCVGFPIAACCGMFYYHVKCLAKMQEALTNNTLAIIALKEKLEG